jgi:glucuronate isomerase
LSSALSQGSEQTELPAEEMMVEQIARLEQISMRLHNIKAHRTVITTFRPNNVVKHEDTRMHDIVSNSSKYYNEGYHSGHPMYQDSIPPNEQYWSHEGGRSKYKKRSV